MVHGTRSRKRINGLRLHQKNVKEPVLLTDTKEIQLVIAKWHSNPEIKTHGMK